MVLPCLRALRIEHQPVEILLDQPHLPGVVGGLEVLQVIAAVDEDEVELAVFGRVALLGEPLVEYQIVLLRRAGDLAPDDERLAAVGRGAGNGAEPPLSFPLSLWERVGVRVYLLEAALQAQTLLTVALERGAEGLGRGDVLDREAD